jgi:hypothetical protein
MEKIILAVVIITVIVILFVTVWTVYKMKQRVVKNYERGLKMIPMLIHLPPSTDDVEGGGRDERDVTEEVISEAQVMYSIISSTLVKGFSCKLYGQKHLSFEIIAAGGFVRYYAVVPAVMTETIKQAVAAAYPTARLEEVEDDNFFNKDGKMAGTAGGELTLKKEFVYPIATFQETKRSASLALLNAMSTAKKEDGIAMQLLIRPTDGNWIKKSIKQVQDIRDRKKKSGIGLPSGQAIGDIAGALWKPPAEREKERVEEKPLSNLETAEIEAIEAKTKFPGFETKIRVLASATTKERAEALLGGIVATFSQFDSTSNNGFRYDAARDMDKLTSDYLFRFFPQQSDRDILNSVELATVFHLPHQNSIPTSQVERQRTKQVDGPARLVEDGVLLGVNEFRGEKKEIRLATEDRRRHVYFIGSTGSGKSTLLTNIAYQDMCDGRGFAFLDPHGDAVEAIMSKVPPERMDDVIFFDPGDLENPIGMNMFEFDNPDQKDFIIQEGINMLYSLFDPGHTGIFGPRGEHMFRNAALLLMSDPAGSTFIDIPRAFIDADFVKDKLKYVTDKTVYDYWTKEFPASQRSNDAGEVTTWFVSKWGPFMSNTMMRNILGQVESGFKIRDIMDNKKILLVNLSKGKMGELNSKLLGMIFVMKFQTAAMGRADIPEEDRTDFCLLVDEFQNYSTESFESILSEARKFRLNLIVANQFMTQLTDKIREGILGNVGTIISGRLGVTDAELMEKAFSPIFAVEDLHKLPNFHTIATVMMYNVPSSPFTMTMLPRMGNESTELLKRMKEYSSVMYGRPRKDVEAEISQRLSAGSSGSGSSEGVTHDGGDQLTVKKDPGKSFLDSWMEKKQAMKEPESAPKPAPVVEKKTAVIEEPKVVETVVKEPKLVSAPPQVAKSEPSEVVQAPSVTVVPQQAAVKPVEEPAPPVAEVEERRIKINKTTEEKAKIMEKRAAGGAVVGGGSESPQTIRSGGSEKETIIRLR